MIDFSALKELSINGINLVTLSINGVPVWERVGTNRVKNWVWYSTEADGKTIYNGGLGYKAGYRMATSGKEEQINDASGTGFIPVNGGDIVRLSGWDFGYASYSNAINVFDSNFGIKGQMVSYNHNYGIFSANEDYAAYGFSSVVVEREGVWKWVVPPADSRVDYIRVSGRTLGDGSKMIITINEPIE